jgi:hypothetical protein
MGSTVILKEQFATPTPGLPLPTLSLSSGSKAIENKMERGGCFGLLVDPSKRSRDGLIGFLNDEHLDLGVARTQLKAELFKHGTL